MEAMFISAANKYTSYWMSTGFIPSLPVNLSADEFLEAVKLRLLIPIIRPNNAYICSCGALPDQNPFHCFACKNCQNHLTRRHNYICRHLKKFITTYISPNVYLEQIIEHTENPRLSKKCDLILYHDQDNFDLIDVAVVYPGADSYTRVTNSNNQAIIIRHNQKNEDYYKQLGPVLVNSLVPFVMENTGNFGVFSNNYIDKICGVGSELDGENIPAQQLACKLRTILSIVLMKYNYYIIFSSRRMFLTR